MSVRARCLLVAGGALGGEEGPGGGHGIGKAHLPQRSPRALV